MATDWGSAHDRVRWLQRAAGRGVRRVLVISVTLANCWVNICPWLKVALSCLCPLSHPYAPAISTHYFHLPISDTCSPHISPICPHLLCVRLWMRNTFITPSVSCPDPWLPLHPLSLFKSRLHCPPSTFPVLLHVLSLFVSSSLPQLQPVTFFPSYLSDTSICLCPCLLPLSSPFSFLFPPSILSTFPVWTCLPFTLLCSYLTSPTFPNPLHLPHFVFPVFVPHLPFIAIASASASVSSLLLPPSLFLLRDAGVGKM